MTSVPSSVTVGACVSTTLNVRVRCLVLAPLVMVKVTLWAPTSARLRRLARTLASSMEQVTSLVGLTSSFAYSSVVVVLLSLTPASGSVTSTVSGSRVSLPLRSTARTVSS